MELGLLVGSPLRACVCARAVLSVPQSGGFKFMPLEGTVERLWRIPVPVSPVDVTGTWKSDIDWLQVFLMGALCCAGRCNRDLEVRY